MNTLDTLFLPDTVFSPARHLPLALFLRPLHLIQPVEDGEDEKNNSLSPDIFTDENLCQVYTPSPLKEDRERFMHLVDDINNRKDDYAAQLTSLTLASMSGKKASVDDSPNSIIAALVGTGGIVSSEEKKGDEALWQARLVLKIAELLDVEQQEIADHMSVLQSHEQDLMTKLKGDGEDLFEDLDEILNSASQPTTAMIEKRVKAWLVLLKSAEYRIPQDVWAGQYPEVLDFIAEKYEKATGSLPVPIMQLELPQRIAISDMDEEGMYHKFRNSTKELTAEINMHLNKLLAADKMPLADASVLVPNAENWSTLWNEHIDTCFPADKYGRTTMMFYFLANNTYADIFSFSKSPEQESKHAIFIKC